MNATALYRVIILTILGLVLTHFMRLLLKRFNVLQKALDKQTIYFIAIMSYNETEQSKHKIRTRH